MHKKRGMKQRRVLHLDINRDRPGSERSGIAGKWVNCVNMLTDQSKYIRNLSLSEKRLTNMERGNTH